MSRAEHFRGGVHESIGAFAPYDHPMVPGIAESVRRRSEAASGGQEAVVTGIRPHDPERDRYSPENTTHHINVSWNEPTTSVSGRQMNTRHTQVHAVDTRSEYTHVHTHHHELQEIGPHGRRASQTDITP